ETREEGQILSPGQVRIKRRRVHEAGDTVRQTAAIRVESAAEDADRTAARPYQSEKDPHQRRLPGTVWAKKTVEHAGSNDQIDATQGLTIAIPLRHTDRFERTGMHWRNRSVSMSRLCKRVGEMCSVANVYNSVSTRSGRCHGPRARFGETGRTST